MIAAAPDSRLHEALRLLPDLGEGEASPAALYAGELLRGGRFGEVVAALAETAELLRWGVLAAHAVTMTPAALRSERWPLEQRRAVDPVRLALKGALGPSYLGAMVLHDAARHAAVLGEVLGSV